jgi:hypothetical protein
LNLRLKRERVGDGVARGLHSDQRERESSAAVRQQRASENPAEGLLKHGVLPWDTVPYGEIRIMQRRDNDKVKPA